MILDFSKSVVNAGTALTFPEWTYPARPLQPSAIVPTRYLKGRGAGSPVVIDAGGTFLLDENVIVIFDESNNPMLP